MSEHAETSGAPTTPPIARSAAPILAPFLFQRDTVLFDMARRHRPTAGLFERKRGFLPYPHPAIVLSCGGGRHGGR